MNKLRAFLTHLAISSCVVGCVFAIVFLVWYPKPYFDIVGAWDVVRILIGVDLVLGPVLTLVVYKPNKPRLRFDLSVIVAIQLAALIYGTHTIYTERPRYLIFSVDRFSVLADKDIDASQISEAVAVTRPLRGPLMAVAVMPDDTEARQKILFETVEGAPDIEFRPELWEPYATRRASVLKRLKPLSTLSASGEENAGTVRNMLAKTGRDAQTLGYLPVMGKKNDAFSLVMERSSGELIAVIPIDPWSLEPTVSDTDSD